MKIVTPEAIAALVARAADSPRRRMNLNLHPEPSDPIGRFLNAGLPGTYVRPDRHRIGKWELVTLLRGELDIVIFNRNGEITNRFAFSLEGASLFEIPGGEWDTVVFHAPAAIVLEVKPGPYEPDLDKNLPSSHRKKVTRRRLPSWLGSKMPRLASDGAILFEMCSTEGRNRNLTASEPS
jgi:cupin fold WbuC family metalloprotein